MNGPNRSSRPRQHASHPPAGHEEPTRDGLSNLEAEASQTFTGFNDDAADLMPENRRNRKGYHPDLGHASPSGTAHRSDLEKNLIVMWSWDIEVFNDERLTGFP